MKESSQHNLIDNKFVLVKSRMKRENYICIGHMGTADCGKGYSLGISYLQTLKFCVIRNIPPSLLRADCTNRY